MDQKPRGLTVPHQLGPALEKLGGAAKKTKDGLAKL